jgi:hypothetical protein
MKQAFAALLGATLTCAACYACGTLLINRLEIKLRRPERLPLAFVLGAACLHLVVFAILALHLAYWPVLVALLVGIIGAAVRTGSWRPIGDPTDSLPKTLQLFCVLSFGLFTILYFFHALAPEASPDGSSYHLAFVTQTLRAKGFERIITNMYFALSAGIETLFVPAFAIGKHSAGALVHFTFLVVLALSMLAYGRRLGKPWTGAVAAFLAYASPVVGIDGSSAYVDAATAAVVFCVFFWLEVWDEQRDDKNLIPIGLLIGFSFAAKYTAVVIALYAVGFVVWRARNLRPIIGLCAWASLMALPWLLKNWIIFQNPVAPFANQMFPNPYFHVSAIEDWATYLRTYDLPSLSGLPLEVTVRGAKTQGLIGPVFLAMPIALLSLRFRAGRRVLVAGLMMLAPYFANIGTRFLIPALPFLGFALALAPGEAPGLLITLMLFHAATSWPAVMQHYAAPGAWRLDRVLFKAALRIVPEDRYLHEVLPTYGMAKMIDTYVPNGERVLALNDVAQAYETRQVLVDYEAAYNNVLADILDTGWVASYQPRVLEQYRLAEHRVRRLRVEQRSRARPQEQWSVQELRFFRDGAELPRLPEWRLTAWPNPWGVQLAFDNSPATRWKTWERAAPGDYLQVDFGREQELDEVRIERSYDYIGLQIEVKMFDEVSRRWITIADQPQVSEVKPDPNIRRYATRELEARGVRYVLIPDSFPGAFDFRADPEGWGLVFVTAGYGTQLYRVAH